MKKAIFTIVFLLSITETIKCQEDSGPLNTGAANFLTIIPDARNAAMGGASVSLPRNDNAIFYNAATTLLDNTRKGGITYTFTPWIRNYESGHSLNSIGGFYKVNKQNVLLAGFRYYNYPSVNVNELNPKKIHPKEFALDIGYAHELIHNLGVSLTLRYIHSDMGSIGNSKKGNAVAFDIGAVYKGDFSVPLIKTINWTTGLQLSNIGSKISYLNTKETLPVLVKAGGTLTLPFSTAHKLTIAADAGYRIAPSDVQSFHVSTGLEYTLINHFMLRGGYHYGNKDKGDMSYATTGAGINFYNVHFDFSWLFAPDSNLLNNTYWISLGYSF